MSAIQEDGWGGEMNMQVIKVFVCANVSVPMVSGQKSKENIPNEERVTVLK